MRYRTLSRKNITLLNGTVFSRCFIGKGLDLTQDNASNFGIPLFFREHLCYRSFKGPACQHEHFIQMNYLFNKHFTFKENLIK